VKNFFLTPEKTYKRKFPGAVSLDGARNTATKDEILELYLNDVYLGQRGSYAIHGVAEARACSSARTSRTSPWPRLRRSRASSRRLAGTRPSRRRPAPATAATSCSRPWRTPVTSASRRRASGTGTDADRGQGHGNRGGVLRRPAGAATGRPVPGDPERTRSVDISTTLDASLQRIAQEAVQAGAIASMRSWRARRSEARPDRARRHRPAGRRHPRLHRRTLLRPVQFNRPLNARRQPDRCSSRSSTWPPSSRPPTMPDRRHAGDARQRRAVHVRLRDQEWTPRTTRTSTTASSRCAARWRSRATLPRCAQRNWRFRQSRGPLEAVRFEHGAAALSIHRARRLRSDADGGGPGVHDLPQRGRAAPAARHRQARERRRELPLKAAAPPGLRVPTPRSSSRACCEA